MYIQYARIEQTEYAVQVIQGKTTAEIPITTVNCMLLGPGTSITHKAVANITAAGCSICWMGCDLATFYAYGIPSTNNSKNLLMQVRYHENKKTHLDVVHKMYQIRYPKERLKTKSLSELRGIEGQHVKDLYTEMSVFYGVEWTGRKYKPSEFASQDTTNQYLTALNHMLYAVCQAVINILGFSTAIGFIHTGNMLSFVYDIADLYKELFVIPLAFKLSAEKEYYSRKYAQDAFRDIVVNKHLLKIIVQDVFLLFDASDISLKNDVQVQLWDFNNFVKSGKNYSE